MLANDALTIEEMHNVTLDILKKIIWISNQIGINYYVAYGTLIGAVRHHGFVPWDDDLDIIIPRDDYNKFVDYCILNKEKIFPFEILYDYKSTAYPYPIARLSDTRFEAVFLNTKPYRCGAFVDIYPYDNAGTGNIEELNQLLKKKVFFKHLLLYNTQEHFEAKSQNPIKIITKLLAYILGKAIPKTVLIKKLESFGKIYGKESTHVACMVWNSTITPVKKWHFEGYEELEFEGITVKVPRGYHDVLEASYGDYMKLPPPEQRIPTHEYQVFRKK